MSASGAIPLEAVRGIKGDLLHPSLWLSLRRVPPMAVCQPGSAWSTESVGARPLISGLCSRVAGEISLALVGGLW